MNFVLALLLSVSAHAAVAPRDNVNRLITLRPGLGDASVSRVLHQLDQMARVHGNGHVQYLAIADVVVANLSSAAAELVARFPEVADVSVERTSDAMNEFRDYRVRLDSRLTLDDRDGVAYRARALAAAYGGQRIEYRPTARVMVAYIPGHVAEKIRGLEGVVSVQLANKPKTCEPLFR